MVTVLVDWEHGDSPSTAGWGGDTGNYENQTSNVYEGSWALEGSQAGGLIYKEDGSTVLEKGDTFSTWLYDTGGAFNRVEFAFFVQSGGDSYYSARMDTDQDKCYIDKNTDTGADIIATSHSYTASSEWVEVEVETTTSDDITVTWKDTDGNTIADLSAVDSSFSSGGYGYEFYLYSDATARADYLTRGEATATTPAAPTNLQLSEK